MGEDLEKGTLVGLSGYTLIELIVTMVVIAVLAGIAIVSLPSSDYKSQVDAEKLIVNIRYAQEKAMSEGGTCCLVFQGNSYSLMCGNKPVPFADNTNTVNLNEAVSVKCGSEETTKVCVDYTGDPDCPNTVHIALGDKEIDIYPYTGGVFEKK